MKAILVGVLSLGMVAFASSAWADHHDHGGGGGGGGGHHESHNGGGGGGGHESHSSNGGGWGGGAHHNSGGGGSHDFMHEHISGHHSDVHVSVHHNNYGHSNHNWGHVTIHGGHSGFHGNVHLAHFHHVFRAPHRYRIGVWHAPRGFYYRRFGIGERVPAVLLVSSYFLNDYYNYGLEEPYDGYVWVRDGDDAVLVDEETGEVIEVEYDVFY